jgi:CelD/BcsL family acetyltransferase involved in cellulose biosynthesis
VDIELLTGPEEIARWAEGWNDLAEEVAQPRAGADLVAAWARHMMPSDSELRVWLGHEGGRVVGVLPLVAESLPQGRERLLPPATSLIYGIIPIARPDGALGIALALSRELAASAAAADVVTTYWTSPGSPWTEAFDRCLTGPEWVALDPAPYSSFYADIAEGFDAWLERRSYKFKKERRRCARRLDEEGFRTIVTTEPAEIVARLPLLKRVYQGRKESRGGKGYRFDEKMIEAIAEAVSASARGRFLLVTVEREQDTQLIAAQLTLRAGDRSSAWLMGFDAQWSRYGPGIVALTGGVEGSAGEGSAIFDLGEGDQAYKRDLIDGEYPLETRIWCRPRMARLLQPRSPIDA